MKWFNAKFSGFCTRCREEVSRGDKVFWANKRLFCAPCGTTVERAVVARDDLRVEARAHECRTRERG